ncbi:MAG: PadR family transcriptional regulator [Methanocella sp.]
MGASLNKFEIEVKRGSLQVVILYLLEEERYGYDIIKNLRDEGLVVEEGTLYPILKRLEDEKMLTSRWELYGQRPRKYFVVTEYGKIVRQKLFESMNHITRIVEKLDSRINEGS